MARVHREYRWFYHSVFHLNKVGDDQQQIDFVAKYYINNDMQLYFNGINLGDEPLYHYFDERNRNAQFEEYGRTFEVGFIWRMQ